MLFTNLSLAQDTTRYYQTNLQPYGSNCYRFYKVKKADKSGSFERLQGFDDGQSFYGKGKFIESKKAIKLKPYLFIKTHDVYKIILKNGEPTDSITRNVRDTFNIRTALTLFKYKNMLYDYYQVNKDTKKRQKVYYELSIKKQH